jgi:hypothetical protein
MAGWLKPSLSITMWQLGKINFHVVINRHSFWVDAAVTEQPNNAFRPFFK